MSRKLHDTPTAPAMDGAAAVWLPLSALRPNPRNPRAHGAEVQRLARTIVRTTWGAPIIAQASTHRIIGGHGRLEAARLIMAGLEVDGIARGGSDHRFDRSAPGPGLVPVRLVDVSDAEADAMTLADNAVALQGHDDAAAVVAMATAAFERDAPTMADMGYAAADLDALVKAAGDAVLAAADGAAGSAGDIERHEIIGGALDGDDPGADEPPPDAPVFSRAGEVYELGPHRLVCGDSRDPAVWALLMGGERLRMVWTDPPYGVSVVGGSHDPRAATYQSGDVVENDDLDVESLLPFLRAALGAALTNCEMGSSWYVAAPDGMLHLPFAITLHELGVWRQTLTWLKHHFVFGRRDYHYRHEPIFYGWTPGAAHYFTDDRTQDSVLEFDRPSRSPEHPTMKPVALVQKCIENSSRDGWLVGDPFGGSGTTLIACAQSGRVARLIELAPRYCDVIRRRWTKFARSAGVDPGPGALDG